MRSYLNRFAPECSLEVVPTGKECLTRMQAGGFDVLILDLQMPGKHGLEILKSLRQEAPRLAVLVLSNYPEDQYAVRALKAGARGYISKTGAPERIVEAIRSLAAGRKYISPEAAEALAATVSGERPEAPHTTLSDREFQILKLIAGGRKLAEIAAELSLSPKTVSVYRARLLEKMGLASNAALTHYALKNALLD
jgi:DNA-binding NarL/FixJ family response regulator